MRRTLPLFLVALLLGACSGGGTDSGSAPAKSELVKAPSPQAMHQRLLPAFETDTERAMKAAKADQADDWRLAHPEWYAITAPPAVESFHAMNEWEPMVANTIAYVDYLSQDTAVRQTLVDIAVNTVAYADLYVVYETASMRTDLIERMIAAGVTQRTVDTKVHFFQIPVDSVWFIDYGPMPLVDDATGNIAFLEYRYYHERYNDDAVPTRLANMIGTTTFRMPFDYEGGNFQADGQGVCYTTQRSFAYAGTQEEIELLLRHYANCQELVILRDIHNDGTGHIDMLFKLVSPTAAIVGSFTTAQDAQAKADMDWNAQMLEERGLTVYRLPMPNAGNDPMYGPIPRTYLNSTMINGPDGKVNLWPVYTVDQDIQAEALAVWQQALPEWEHVGIISDDISLLSGAVHCVTRTIPAGPFGEWVPNGTCENSTCNAPAGGYAGTCASDDECFGPEWLCNTNQCAFVPDEPCETAADCREMDCTATACVEGMCEYTSLCGAGETCFLGSCVAGCGDVPWEGCCEGNVAVWCQDGQLQGHECGADEPVCSWTGELGYYCGPTDGGTDPSGLPRTCGTYFASCTSDADCDDQDLCTTSDTCVEGRCVYDTVACEAGEVCNPTTGACEACVPQCDGRQCGDDGCGGSCGECAAGFACTDGACVQDPQAFCDVIGMNGCCDGAVVTWCEDGAIQTIDCTQNEAPGNTCGWSDEGGYFDCGGTGTVPADVDETCPWNSAPCGTDAECDDANPCTIDACVDGMCSRTPTCTGENEICDPQTGECTVCVPQCNGCGGDDGCGGTCACGAGESCFAGQCVAGCGGVTWDGCCDGNVAWYCNEQENVLISDECPEGTVCTWTGDQGYYCAEQDGGTDPGGLPLECSEYLTAGCTADEQCDDGDACTTDTCTNGECASTPIEGCCAADAECNDFDPCTDDACVDGACQSQPIADCVCDPANCDDGNPCTEASCADNACVFTPIDGCCVEDAGCDDGDACTADTCTENVCSNVAIEECCSADVECDSGDLCSNDACVDNACVSTPVECPPEHSCDPTDGICKPADCIPACDGKVCGADGCGGVCGTCDAGFLCDDYGQCIEREDPCDQCTENEVCVNDECVECQCGARQCGAPLDGCPSCGACGEGEVCTADGMCETESGADTQGGSDVDPGTPGDGGSSGGCSATPGAGGNAPTGLLLLAMLGGLVAVRRRRQ